MMWNSEADFVQTFLSSKGIINRLTKKKYKILTEVRTGFGRPDILIIEYNPKVIETRLHNLNRNAGVFSTKSAFALSYLSTCRWVTVDNLGKFLNCHGSQLKAIISILIGRGLLETKDHLVKLRPRVEILAIERVWAFEAKLSHWKEAIEQAERHLWFTRDSYVLMPTIQKDIINTITCECDKRGIGLSLFNVHTGFDTVVKPAKSGVRNSPFLWMLNEMIVGGNNDGTSVLS